MNTNALASALAGFLLGGLTVSVAAQMDAPAPAEPEHGSGVHDRPRR